MGIFEQHIDQWRTNSDYVNTAELAALEQELQEVKQAAGIPEKRSRFCSFIDKRISACEEKDILRKTYITLLLSCGWFCGSHLFYAGKRIRGMLYLLFCWTGIPFAMSLIDLMQVLPIAADSEGKIRL